MRRLSLESIHGLHEIIAGVAALGIGLLFLVTVWVAVGALQRTLPAPAEPAHLNADLLYQMTRVWKVHLRLEPEQWGALQPANAADRFPFGPHAPGGRQDPSASVAARALASLWMSQADRNRDGSISPAEWNAYAERWLTDAPATQGQTWDADRMRAALEAMPNLVAVGITALLLGPEGRRNGIAAAFGIDFPYVRADLELNGYQFHDVGLRYKGNGTFLEARGSLKRSFKVQLNRFNPR